MKRSGAMKMPRSHCGSVGEEAAGRWRGEDRVEVKEGEEGRRRRLRGSWVDGRTTTRARQVIMIARIGTTGRRAEIMTVT